MIDRGRSGPGAKNRPMNQLSPRSNPDPRDQVIGCAVSGGFPQWLSEAGGTLALTTYQAGKVGLIGWDGRQVSLLFRDFEKPMGLSRDGSRLLLATRHQLFEFADAP